MVRRLPDFYTAVIKFAPRARGLSARANFTDEIYRVSSPSTETPVVARIHIHTAYYYYTVYTVTRTRPPPSLFSRPLGPVQHRPKNRCAPDGNAPHDNKSAPRSSRHSVEYNTYAPPRFESLFRSLFCSRFSCPLCAGFLWALLLLLLLPSRRLQY